ncbi:hypothetical protein [Neorhizobium sp. T7_12]|uniref:hypothetical protein n=1 Tax=Neorhizobium sp. T7_12 TaxID=2093832 RepID=UPI00155EDC59|nr:hypothetical protein [Neorhizobium sp. T7_12]
MRIGLRVYIYSMFVIVAALSLLGLMSIVKYENILTETLAKRLTTVTEDARASVEKADALGVSLRALTQQDGGPIDVAAGLLPSDMRIAVVDPRGDLIRRPGETAALPVSVDALVDRIAAKQSDWHLRENGYLVAGSTVVNSFGEPEGAIIAVQSDAVIESRNAAMLRDLVSFSLLTLIPTAILAAFVVYFSLRPLGRSISAMRSVVEEQNAGHLSKVQGPLAPTLHWFGRIFGDLELQRGQALTALNEIEAMATAEGRRDGR